MRTRLALVAFLFVIATRVYGQGATGIHFGIAAGGAFPTGDAGDVYDTSWHGSAMLNFNAPIVGLRFEGMYTRMEEKSLPGASGHVQIGGATANLVIGPKALAVRPYFIGGGGLYRVKFSATRAAGDFDTTQNRAGWNAGGGISFGVGPIGTVFVEARYVRITTDPFFGISNSFTFIPVTVGLVF